MQSILFKTYQIPGFLYSCQEFIIAEWLKKVINHIELITFQSIFCKCSCENYLRAFFNESCKLNSRQIRHLDINENKIDLIARQKIGCVKRVIEFPGKL